MFAKQLRLPATVKLTRATFITTPDWKMKFSTNGLQNNRYGFVIRKTVDKRAVVRNRIKRVFRSGVEELHPKLQQGYDMLFLLEKGIMDKQQAQVTLEIETALKKKHLL